VVGTPRRRRIDEQRLVGGGPRGRADVKQFLLQWFIDYNMKKGRHVVTSPIVTANWEASSNNVWNVPFGGGLAGS
jgi:hypothetical protein